MVENEPHLPEKPEESFEEKALRLARERAKAHPDDQLAQEALRRMEEALDVNQPDKEAGPPEDSL